MLLFFMRYWRLMRGPTALEAEIERDREFSRRTGWMRLGALERERESVKDLKFR